MHRNLGYLELSGINSEYMCVCTYICNFDNVNKGDRYERKYAIHIADHM